jgi:hypothetical protein
VSEPVTATDDQGWKIARILVTGSRDWSDRWVVAKEIERFLGERGLMDPDMGMSIGKVVIVHGDCPTGADFWAKEWAINEWQSEEPHPANWRILGEAAGPVRNQIMVRSEPDICLAFLNQCRKDGCRREPHTSHGASGCADMAEAAGVEVRRFLGATPQPAWKCARPRCGGHIGAGCLPSE